MGKAPAEKGAGPQRRHALDTRPLLNFTYTDRVDLLERLLGKPIHIPAAVHEQWKAARSALEGKLRELPAHRRDPLDVRLLDNLNRARGRFRGTPFRVVPLYDPEEAERAEELREEHPDIDPGEADVLALCLHRGPGWVAVLDDRPAHDLALTLGIPTMGTIELLMEAVKRGLLSLNDGEHLLEEMRTSWPRAPQGRLQGYISGERAVW